MKKAFTLAEVLITLGIIGVVAAMTLPSLVASYNSKVLDTQSKKVQSVLSNGIKLLMAKEDTTSLANIPLMSCTTKDCISSEMHKAFNIVSEINLDSSNIPEKYQFTNGEFSIWNDSNLAYGFVTPDGTMVGVKKFEPNTSNITFVVDLNGGKKPNKGAEDLCKYTISSTGIIADYCSSMQACGGSASNGFFEQRLNRYSFGMQSAEALPEFGEDYCKENGGTWIPDDCDTTSGACGICDYSNPTPTPSQSSCF